MKRVNIAPGAALRCLVVSLSHDHKALLRSFVIVAEHDAFEADA